MDKIDKRTIILTVIVLLCVMVMSVRLLTPEDTWLCENGMWVKHGNPDTVSAPTTKC